MDRQLVNCCVSDGYCDTTTTARIIPPPNPNPDTYLRCLHRTLLTTLYSPYFTRVQAGGGDENTRPLLSDMKMMVMEGECLLSSAEAEGVISEGSAPVTTSARGSVSSRELSKAQSVVEVAEEVRGFESLSDDP